MMHRYAANFRRRSGIVELSRNFVRFNSDDGSESFEILSDKLQIEVGGRNRPLVLLSSSSHPGEIISSTHTDLLHSLSNLGYPDATHIFATLQKTKTSRYALIGGTAGILLVLLIGLPMIAASLPSSWIDQLISRDRERTLIRALPTNFFGAPLISPNNPLDRKMERLVFWLQQHSETLRDIPIEVHVSPDPDINAFAYPGDYIFVNEGLILHSDDIEMLAGVLAHELGHIEKRHNLKAIGTGLSLLTGATLLSLVIGTDAAGFMLNGLQFGTLKYSRDHEREADDAGVRILLNAGLSPRGLVRFFEKLKAKEGFGSSSALNLLSTHPMTEERISRLKARAAELPVTAPDLQLPINLKEIKESLAL